MDVILKETGKMEQYRNERDVACAAARKAGELILSQAKNLRAKKKGLEFKAEVDTLADQTIKQTIASAFPNDSILTEESGFPTKPSERLWIVDPLDGTTNFLNGFRAYSTLIAFAYQDQLAVGVSFLPQTGEVFWAVEGRGAYKNNKRMAVSKLDDLGKATVILDPGYHPSGTEKITEAYKKLRPKVGSIGIQNANGYTLSLLASGEIPALVHFSSKVWECAGLLLVKEAGGKITDFKGREIGLDFTKETGFEFIATNGPIHSTLRKLLDNS